MLNFDAMRFLEAHFADNSSVREEFGACGITPPSFEQLRKWRQRERISADWLARILYVIEIRQNQPPAISNFMTGDSTKCMSPSKAKPKSTGVPAGIFD